MNYGLVLGLFDLKIGPYPVYLRDVSKDVASKVVIKGTIFQGSLQTSQTSGESIISFPTQEISAYIYLYLLEIDKTEFPILIAFVSDIKEQSDIYRDADQLRSIASLIKEDILKIKDYPHNSNLSHEIENIMETKYDKDYLNSFFSNTRKLTQIADQNGSSDYQIRPLNLISKMVKKNLDQVIYGLITGVPIIIFGKDSQLIKLTSKTFELVTPHRNLKTTLVENINNIEDSIALYDLIGTTKPVKANKSFILIDLEKGNIKGGRKNKYCEHMFTDLVEAENENPKLLEMLANRRINWLLTSVSVLIQVEDEKSQKDAIKKLSDKVDRDSLYLIAKLVENKNPLMFKHIISNYSLKTRFFKSIF